MKYDVSAVIPVLGPQPLLARAVESALANAGIAEVIIVDDGSAQPIEAPTHPKVRLIRHEATRGAAAARNTGARHVSGEWIAFLDADDAWDARKTEMQMNALRNDNTDALGAVCAFRFMRDGRLVVRRPPHLRLTLPHALAGARFGLGSAMIVSRAAFLEFRGYDESFTRYEDWEWLLRILTKGHFIAMPDALVSVTHGYRADPAIALEALARLARMHDPAGSTPAEARIFKAAAALERASLLLSGNRRLAAVLSMLEAARHRPLWAAHAVALAGQRIHTRCLTQI